MIRITECPRDAMQGIKQFIPTGVKATYLNLLLKAGFDRLDFGSFVSPAAMPQMADTAAVLSQLHLNGDTRLLAIIANIRGAEEALQYEEIHILGFPFSLSETFQLRNTNSTREQALSRVAQITDKCLAADRTPLVYLSMAFGNPYGDEWNTDIVSAYTEQLVSLGIKNLVLADTTGSADAATISDLYPFMQANFPEVEWGLHLHSLPKDAADKLRAALAAGCSRFDTALRGFGGCPMATDRLTGNTATETLFTVLKETGWMPDLNEDAWQEALEYSKTVFGR